LTRLHERAPRVLIFGSCVSRDILNFAGGSSRITLVDYYARSSIASLETDPCDLDEAYFDRIKSDFQRRMVRRDLSKAFLQDVVQRRDFDFILIDLIDERFDMYEVAPGAMATISGEFLATRYVTSRDRSSERWIRSGSERHRALWKAGVKRLFTLLAEHGLSDRVIVNKVFWADRMEDGAPLGEEDAGQREAANSLLAWMYEELAAYVPAPRWMEFPGELLRSSPAHRWGIAPFHYTNGYYAKAVEQLNGLYADRRNDGGIALDNRTLMAWSGISDQASHRTCFLVFRDTVLVHKQPYSTSAEMQFDTAGMAGDYEVVVFTLTFSLGEQLQPTRRRESVLHFHIPEMQSSDPVMDAQ
jgi:hypothetical protein